MIAPSFADIFFNNCFKNGILPIVLPEAEVAQLMEDARQGDNAKVTIDLEAQEISGIDGRKISFDIDPFRKECLLEGVDDIGLTLKKADAIQSFEDTRNAQAWS